MFRTTIIPKKNDVSAEGTNDPFGGQRPFSARGAGSGNGAHLVELIGNIAWPVFGELWNIMIINNFYDLSGRDRRTQHQSHPASEKGEILYHTTIYGVLLYSPTYRPLLGTVPICSRHLTDTVVAQQGSETGSGSGHNIGPHICLFRRGTKHLSNLIKYAI